MLSGVSLLVLGAGRSMPLVVMPAWWLLPVFLFVDLATFSAMFWLGQLYCRLKCAELDAPMTREPTRRHTALLAWYTYYGRTSLLLGLLALVTLPVYLVQLFFTITAAPRELIDGTPCPPVWQLSDVPYYIYNPEAVLRVNAALATTLALGPFVFVALKIVQ